MRTVKEPITAGEVLFSCTRQDCQAELGVHMRDGVCIPSQNKESIYEFSCPYCRTLNWVPAEAFRKAASNV